MRNSDNWPFWGVFGSVLAADVSTKALAVHWLTPERLSHPVAGDVVRFTLVYNPGAAFGLHVGPYSRWIFMALTASALVILWRLFVGARPTDRARMWATSLVAGGAVGNLIDRVRSARGVVDFIDVGFGDARWPTFNVADVAVSCGALLLAWVLWEEEETDSVTASVTTSVTRSSSGATPESGVSSS